MYNLHDCLIVIHDIKTAYRRNCIFFLGSVLTQNFRTVHCLAYVAPNSEVYMTFILVFLMAGDGKVQNLAGIRLCAVCIKKYQWKSSSWLKYYRDPYVDVITTYVHIS